MEAGRTIPYTPEQIQAMHRAYDLTCDSLGVSGAADRTAEIVADKIIQLARSQEFDPERCLSWRWRIFGQTQETDSQPRQSRGNLRPPGTSVLLGLR